MDELKLDMHAHMCAWVCVCIIWKRAKKEEKLNHRKPCVWERTKEIWLFTCMSRGRQISLTVIYTYTFFFYLSLKYCFQWTWCAGWTLCVQECVFRQYQSSCKFRTLRLRKQTSHLYERGSLRKEHTHTHLQHTDQISIYIHANYTNTH